jgi:uncharacterized protein (TIGR02300 family)
MATKANRGTKRTCQNDECGARFYDLERDPITCPICGGVYQLASSPGAIAAAVGEEKAARKPARRPEPKPVVEEGVPADATAEEGDVPLADVEGEEAITAEEDETFLEEEEEDGGDVSNIIGGPVAEDEEEP